MSDDFSGGGETGALIRSFDWSTTPLGPISGWPMSLKSLVRVMIHSRQPMLVWWGPELTQIYNDGMLDSMRDKHPNCMGQPGREAWQQAWRAVGHELQRVVDFGDAILNDDMYVPVDRSSRIEDAWWTYSYSPVYGDDGERAGILIICTETTAGVVARKQLERARREADLAREELNTAFMQAPMPIAILTGEDFVFTFANPAYERFVARPVLGRSLSEAFTEEEVGYYKPLLAQVYQSGQPLEIQAAELRLPNADGVIELRYIDAAYYPHRNTDLKTIGIISLVSDVTAAVTARLEAERSQSERTAMLEREKALRAQAEEANRLKDDFLATVSHELRTPLTAIVGWVHLLQTTELSTDRAHRALATIERNARAQSQLIEDLLDIARITSGKLKLEVETIDLAPIIEAALESVRPAAEARDIRIQASLDSTLSTRGDAARLQQIAWNLLSNAVKFTPRGGRVDVALERQGTCAELTVSDNGRGIDPAFLPYIFERFRQAEGSSTREYGGLGLGLAIVKHLVELHGGVIMAESPGLEQGATFRVRLPVAAMRVEPAAADSARRELQEFHCPPELKGLRLLVVDDEADTRDLLQALLERCEIRVETAASAAEALAKFDSFQPEFLLSDIGMPSEDGYSLIRKVRARSAAAGGRIPAVALTAFARAEDRTQALRAGFKAHVPKPVEPAELVAVIAALAPQRDE